MELTTLMERMKMEHLLSQLYGVCEKAAQGDLDFKGLITSALEAECVCVPEISTFSFGIPVSS